MSGQTIFGRWRKGTPMQRWCAKVRLPVEDRDDGCWEWTGGKVGGYGQFWPTNGKNFPAHKYSYERFIGPIPDGLQIDHLCRNRGCVNPLHLEPVTAAENLRRAPLQPSTVNSIKSHCPLGHELFGDNVHRYGGHRHCKICRAIAKKTRTTAIPLGTAPKRGKARCRNGHEFTDLNTYLARGSKVCRACHRATQLAYTARKHGEDISQA